MGYSATQKGYFLLYLDTKKIFISRDVFFKEYKFPFTKSAHAEPLLIFCLVSILMQLRRFLIFQLKSVWMIQLVQG